MQCSTLAARVGSTASNPAPPNISSRRTAAAPCVSLRECFATPLANGTRFTRNGAMMGRSCLRRSSVAYATETADGGLRPPQPVMSPKHPMAAGSRLGQSPVQPLALPLRTLHPPGTSRVLRGGASRSHTIKRRSVSVVTQVYQ